MKPSNPVSTPSPPSPPFLPLYAISHPFSSFYTLPNPTQNPPSATTSTVLFPHATANHKLPPFSRTRKAHKSKNHLPHKCPHPPTPCRCPPAKPSAPSPTSSTASSPLPFPSPPSPRGGKSSGPSSQPSNPSSPKSPTPPTGPRTPSSSPSYPPSSPPSAALKPYATAAPTPPLPAASSSCSPTSTWPPAGSPAKSTTSSSSFAPASSTSPQPSSSPAPTPTPPRRDLAFFVRDLFTRLQIGGLEFKRKALDSLIQLLSDDDKSASVVAKEGNMSCLVSLLDLNVHFSIRELAVVAVSLIVSTGDSPRKCVFEEGALGPLLRIIECGTMQMKESAAMAIEFITDDPDNAWAVSAYGGVAILIELCKSGSITAQSHAAGAIRNVSSVEDIRIALAEEGAIPILMQLLVSGSPSTQGKVANCISILASSNEQFRGLLLQEKGLQRLLHLFCECSSSETSEHVLRAIYSLSVSDAGYRMLSGSTAFILQIAELVKHGNVMLQHISASLLANLAISDGNKRAIVGCMGSLMKLMESVKPDGMHEVGAKALLSLLMVNSNKKEFLRDEKSLMRLVQMLDPRNEVVSKKFPVAVVAALMAGGSQGCRRRLVAAGAHGHMQRLAELDVPGAKNALQRLSTNRLTSILTRAWRNGS